MYSTKTKVKFKNIIQREDWRLLKTALEELDPIQVAQLIESASADDEVILFRLLGRAHGREVFKLLSHQKQEEIIEGLAEKSQIISKLLNDIKPDDRTAFLGELPGKVAQRLLQYLSPEKRSITNKLLGYSKDSIGRLMTPEFVAIKSFFTVEMAFAHIRKYGRDSETLNVIYIVDEDWKLIDDIRIKELLLASPQQAIKELMDNRFIALNANEDQETAIKVFRDYDRVALPVVNEEGVLLGIVTFDDIMDVVEEESTEDFHKFGSFQTAISNPLKTRLFSLYKNRIVWLMALVFVNIFSGAALSNFEDVIQSAVALVFFLPLLIDSGGNAGSQSATLMIRSLAMGEVRIADLYKLIGKELVVAVLLGTTMALGVALIANFRAPEIMAVVALTMIITVVIGSLTGMLLPFIFTKLKLDPATASAPLITSISDICGVLVYFSMASWLLA
ncbi:magnesium transporter [Saccharicrinis carchari]|uniref:Magnesium transporter MgtE n=1 Tax=Saccharicrinis carchari TaxID=1168039 RepID=A0A521D184_SACCC|nr:magnesium transporter [Saccharicrinis carchari]SMO65434.1 magnesium transporter [Saccharicrinis carchari]